MAADAIDGEITVAEEAVVVFARKVARDASTIRQEDVDTLRAHGYSDAQVFDIATTVAGRLFLTKILDALGVQMDITAMDMSESFGKAMTVGRPICEDEVELLDT